MVSTASDYRSEHEEFWGDSLRPKRSLFGGFAKAVTSTLAALALTGALITAKPAEQVPTYHQTTEQVAPSYRAGVDGPNSLWAIAEHHLASSLPSHQPARDHALIEATDALAAENEYCPPTLWNALHPKASYEDALACEDGSPSPHIIGYGERVEVSSITPPDVSDSKISDAQKPTKTAQEPVSDETPAYRAGVDGPNSLWAITEHHLEPILPSEQPDRNQMIVEATDALAVENEYCPPTAWNALHPKASYQDALACEDGSPSPHIIGFGERVEVSSLEERVRAANPDPDEPVLGDDATMPNWRFYVAGAVAAAGAAAYIHARRQDETTQNTDALLSDPKNALESTPHGTATLAFGHAYLAQRNYLDRTSDEPSTRRIAGAARSSLERKAARLNRLAAMLDTPYVPHSDVRSIADRVREAVGADVTDETARRYVKDLASLGHENAQAAVAHLPKRQRVLRSKRRSRALKAKK